MRTLLAIVISATIFWSAYWAIGAQRTKAETNAWLVDKNNSGVDIRVEDVSLWGFPNRFDVTLSPISIEVMDWGFAWRAAFLQILRLSYEKDHSVFVFPEYHHLKIAENDVEITSDQMRASSVFLKEKTHRIVLEAKELHLRGTNFDVRFENAQLALLLSTDQNKLRLTLLSGNTASFGGPQRLSLSAEFASDQLLIDQDLTIFDVRSLRFYNISLQLEDKIMFQTSDTLGFADLFAEPVLLQAMQSVKMK